jgi:hypothetical protein
MALFQKRSNMQKLEIVVAALRKRGQLLADKRVNAQAAFDAAISAQQELLISGDLDDEKLAAKMQSAVDVAASRLHALDDAVSTLAQQTIAAEGQLAVAALADARKTASELLVAQIADIDRLLPKFLSVSSELAAALRAISWRFETASLGEFVARNASEVEMAASLTSNDLRASPANVLAGVLDAALARPVDVVPPLVSEPAPPPMVQLFLLSAVEFTDPASGRVRRIGKWLDCELSPVHAERALRFGKAVPQTDPRRNELRGVSVGAPHPSWCFSLDHEPASGIQASSPSQFEPVNRGPARTMQVVSG